MTDPEIKHDIVLLTVSEAAKYLTVKESWVRYALHSKVLPCYRIGKAIRFGKKDLNKFLEKYKVMRVYGIHRTCDSCVYDDRNYDDPRRVGCPIKNWKHYAQVDKSKFYCCYHLRASSAAS